ncbi:MBL fold metallo-hydrolase [Streptomyces sp. NPDC051684]|uniref:MBL fold metallo-hydrolase n=1 Tax=Streptomyces sp. NPDC051684 TaxID=3365670 RepID=UPI0037BB7112
MRMPGDGGDRTAITVTGHLQKDAWGRRVLPPVEHLSADVWSVPVPIPANPLRYTLSYLIPGDSGLVVVDPGWASEEGWDALCRGLAEAGASPGDVTGILATHVHPDHHGLTGRLREASDAWVAMHPAERDSLPQRRAATEPSPADTPHTWLREAGAPESDIVDLLGPDPKAVPSASRRLVEPDVLLEDKDPLPLAGREFVALWTPGHTPGHLCLAESTSRVVLTGDHILPRITPNIGLHGRRPGQDPLGDFLGSLERLADWDDHEALPAHEYRFRGLAARTGHLRAHHAERLDELLALVDAAGSPTLWEVTAGLTWSRPWDQVGKMRFAALAETEAHVRHLVGLGVLAAPDDRDRPVRVSRPVSVPGVA